MHRTDTGSVNWNALAALAATVAAVAALLTAVSISRQVQQETERSRFSTGLESLWHLAAEWDSASMDDARSNAAAALLAGQPTADVDEVLDFFDELALLVDRGVLDAEMVCYQFYYPMANYWFASQDYVHEVQREDPEAWRDLDKVMTRLVAIEARRKRRTAPDVVPSTAQIRDFLMDEQGDAECADDTETRKTPL
jgi:hypothetical protein